MLKVAANNSFALVLANGADISVAMGGANYCDRRNIRAEYGEDLKVFQIEARNAEILIKNSLRVAITHHFVSCVGQVAGYVGATMLAEILGKLASMTKEELDNLEPFIYPTFED